jgi:hypothetical protein
MIIRILSCQNKLGLVAHQVGAKVVFVFPNITNTVRFLTIHSLKSYGEKWQGSEAEFSFQIHNKGEIEYERFLLVEGWHGLNNSVTYPSVLDLGNDHIAMPGKNVSLTITLTGGSSFKITALLLCRWL